jgi:hypothetical protein
MRGEIQTNLDLITVLCNLQNDSAKQLKTCKPLQCTQGPGGAPAPQSTAQQLLNPVQVDDIDQC